MRRSVACTVVGLMMLTVLVGSTPSVGAVTYTFTKIADTQGEFASFGVFPSINDDGTVAFEAELKAGGQAIFAGSGGPLTTIAPPGTGSPLGSPSINSSGTLAFLGGSLTTPAGFAGGGILTGSGGPVTIIVHNAVPPYGGFADPVINDAGTLAFVAQQKTGPLEVLRGNAPPFTLLADNRGAIDGFVNNRVAINASGRVTFYARFKTSAVGAAVLVGDGVTLTTIADTSGPFAGFGEGPAINDAGMVAFPASLKAGGAGVFISDGATLTTVADTAGGFRGFGFVDINNGGRVAFTAVPPVSGGGDGIFTGPDPTVDRVIGTGDVLHGSTVRGLGGAGGGSRLALNNHGQIAFVATLADGTEGVFRADPVLDEDNDGIPDAEDICPGTVIPETVPTVRLGVNRFALTSADGIFDTVAPKGEGPKKAFTIADTAGCSCEQIIEALGLGEGHTKFGCSLGAMREWVDMVTP